MPGAALLAREPGDFSDLMEGEHEVFGSEKELKYKIRGFPLVEWEKWDNHSSVLVMFGLYKSTNYPKFTSFRILPFVYYEASKLDDRYRTFIFPLFLYHRVDGDDKLTWAPFYYHHRNNTESFRWLALYISNVTEDEYDRAILPLVWFGGSEKRGSSYFTFFPLFSMSRSEKEHSFSLITPVFYHSSDQTSAFSISPLHFYSSGGHVDAKTDSSVNDSVTMGFPILPFLFYRSRDGSSVHYNVATLFDFGFESDKLDRIWVWPLLFYGRDRYFYSPFFMTAHVTPEDETWFRHVPIALFFSWGKVPKNG
ncbi:MAG: hypothetical protein HY042_02145, partial [Spirochaetia bacterium]|nr:hypothetical protein [Spirochaetia bacterium]